MNVLMKCGHTANALINGKPCCAICVPKREAFEIANKPNLDGRKAKCYYCGEERKSNYDLPFFEYNEDKEYDTYYCGCYGWD